MAEAFLRLSPEEQADILQTLATKLGRRTEHLEKDIWLCWVFHGLFGMPGRLPMAFKGGTSLSKVYSAIRRFSEDVDITVDYKSLDQSIDPFDPKVSRTGRDKYTELLRIKLADHTNNVIRPHFANLLSQLPDKPTSPLKNLKRRGKVVRPISVAIRTRRKRSSRIWRAQCDRTQ